ncbi:MULTISPECIES: agmatinase [Prochlorococcus]|uniref:agmatinase n=1 Tax=Prochlorococcus TaxID=1218 RepID=UPI0005337D6F|nr:MULTISPECIES: agmatinase [Prochlorococcus]KGG13720.1 Agmatinase [Prochlorococcus sp. MIT 0601]
MKLSKSPKFNTDGPIFMGSQSNPKNCKIGICGIPYDGTTSFRPGTRFGPSEIKNVSNSIESFCPQLGLDLEEIKYIDFGSLEIPHGAPEPVINLVKEATNSILSQGIKPLLLGGEHSITIGSIKSIIEKYPDVIVLQLDAHADLRSEWLGSCYNHACVIRRCLEILPSKTLFQVAIRSGTREEFKEMKADNRLVELKVGEPANNLYEILKPFKNKPIYLTIDLDWFDPSVLPGTGTPEPGGFFWQDFAAVINVIQEHRIIGADIVELSPILDNSGISSVLAAKVTRSLIMLMSL